MEASTKIPMPIANPPKDIKSADNFILFINMKAKRMENGRENVAIKDDLKSPMKRKRMNITKMIPNSKEELTVNTHFFTNEA